MDKDGLHLTLHKVNDEEGERELLDGCQGRHRLARGGSRIAAQRGVDVVSTCGEDAVEKDRPEVFNEEDRPPANLGTYTPVQRTNC